MLHVDGYLCEVKDGLIRDGLHILGAAPAGEARVNLVLAMLRAAQVWGGAAGALPGLRTALGLAVRAPRRARDRRASRQRPRALVEGMDAARLGPGARRRGLR